MVMSRPLRAASILMSAVGVGVFISGCEPKPQAAAPAQTLSATEYPVMAPLEQYLIADRDAEVALARTAAPPGIANDATILVLTRQGYQTAVEGKNGFVCFVDRSWSSPFDDSEYWNPKKRGPTCMNAPAARSALPVTHRLTELALAGQPKDAILARMKESIARKEFGPPEIGSMSYMMSKDGDLGDGVGPWLPHLMVYAPKAAGANDGASWGADLPTCPVLLDTSHRAVPEPETIFMIPVAHWSDGRPGPEPTSHRR